MLLSVHSRLTYQLEHLTPAWFFLLAAQTEGQTLLSESLELFPQFGLHEGQDPFHTRTLYGLLPPGSIEVSYQARIQLQESSSPTLVVAPDPIFLQASRYCCPLQCQGLVQEVLQDPQTEWEAAQQIVQWVQAHLHYCSGSSNSRTRAIDTLLSGEGVCRDFSHVTISLCRATGLPARYVSAYAYQLDPPDFHALVEVFADGRWHLLDPTGRANVAHTIRIGCGRDAGDIPVAEFSEPVNCRSLSVVVEAIPSTERPTPTWETVEIA